MNADANYSSDSDASFVSATDTMADNAPDFPPAPPAHAPPAPNVPGAQGEQVTRLGFTIDVPDLVNGLVAEVTQAAPKASVDRMYKWVAITNMSHEVYVAAVSNVIRATYAHLLVCTGGQPSDALKADLRRRAIVLGAVRAGAAGAYKIGVHAMNTEETVAAGMSYVPGNQGALGRVVQDAGDNTAGVRWTHAVGMAAPDATEVNVIGMLVYLGMAVPVLQGASLVNSGHHYLPTTKNIFAGMRRQALALTSDAGRQWVESMGDVFDDLAFHKACHPISPPRKRTWAKDSQVAERLRASGHGAAAIRLPAIPSDAAIGKAAIALAMAATPTIRSMGHTISVTHGRELVRALEQAPEGPAEREAVVDIVNWASTHAAGLALCAGIVQHVHETSGTGRNTLLNAYSIKKLMSEQSSQVMMGVTYARVASAKAKTALESGEFADPALVM